MNTRPCRQAPMRKRVMRAAALGLACAGLASLAGCGKVSEVASEKAAEKIIEASINKDGNTNAQVDMSSGGVKIEGKDEHGKTFRMEMGSAQVSEKDLGMPFYPGAKPVENKATRIVNDSGSMVQLELASSDDPKKVSDWYRAQLKASQEGKLVMDQGKDKGMTLSISDTQDESSRMVDISDDGHNGSAISLMYSAKRAKAGS